MNSFEIIKESVLYPINNIVPWIIFGIVVAISLGVEYYGTLSNGLISMILGVIGFILAVLIEGFNVNVAQNAIKGDDEIPRPKLEQIVLGIKSLILTIVYYIIPTIISLILAIPVGLFDNLGKISEYANGQNIATLIINNQIPANLMNDLFVSLGAIVIVAVILFIIFYLFKCMGFARLAESESLKEGLNIPAVFSHINSIGWLNFIVFYILLVIVLLILGIIGGLIASIPYVGVFLTGLLFYSYIKLFSSYALGLIYAEG